MLLIPPIFLQIFAVTSFIPHGHCYLWNSLLVWLHIISDSLIALAYYSIPITLVYFVRKRSDLPYANIFLLFSAFIISCGTTHLVEIWTLWHPNSWVSGWLKAITALISLYTAIELIPIVSQALSLPSPAQLELANRTLANEIAERKQAEERLQNSEKHLSAIFSQAAVGLSEISLDGHFQRINDELCRILERSREEMLTIGVPNVTHPEDIPKSLEAFQQMVEIGLPISLDKRYLRPDGTIVWANSSLTRLDDEQGHPYSVLAVTVDLSDRQQAQENLRESEERYRAIVNQALTGVAYSDLGGKLTIVNQKYCDIIRHLRKIISL